MKKQLLASVLTTLAVGASVTALPASPANAAPGKRSLATVLAADGHHFDRKWGDFDILDKAVSTVLAAKPNSAVAVLADGSTALTAFLPTDRAFRRLVHDLTGKRPRTERATFNRLAKAAGVDTIEQVLLYHVVPGSTITYAQAKASDGAALKTALGPVVRVNVRKHGRIALQDRDPNDANAIVKRSARNINQGNLQIAHGISRVLRPADL
ncbi:MAG: fasciclin domain-containing protein [Marmoricola sp.]